MGLVISVFCMIVLWIGQANFRPVGIVDMGHPANVVCTCGPPRHLFVVSPCLPKSHVLQAMIEGTPACMNIVVCFLFVTGCHDERERDRRSLFILCVTCLFFLFVMCSFLVCGLVYVMCGL